MALVDRYLADTSILVEHRLRNPLVRAIVEELLIDRRIYACTLTNLEINFASQTPARWDERNGGLQQFEFVELEQQDLNRASSVQRMLATVGHQGRSIPDLIISAVAERHQLAVLHYDRDYEMIAAVTGQAVEWVAPRGSLA